MSKLTKHSVQVIAHIVTAVVLLALLVVAWVLVHLGDGFPDWLRPVATVVVALASSLHLVSAGSLNSLVKIASGLADGVAPTLPQIESAAESVVPESITNEVKADIAKVEKIAHGPLGSIVKADLLPIAEHYGITTDGLAAPAIRKAITAAEKELG